jgi:putative drug exporter of the RND superfamily
MVSPITRKGSRVKRTKPSKSSNASPSPGPWLARRLVDHRVSIVFLWLAAIVTFVPLANGLENSLAKTALGANGNSVRVTEILREKFGSPFAETALLVADGIPDPRTTAGDRVLRTIDKAVSQVSGVSETLSFLDGQDAFLIGDHGQGVLLIAGLDTKHDTADAIVLRLRQTTAALSAKLGHEAPSIRLNWTGETALNRDIRDVGRDDATTAELRTLPLTLAALIIVFGSVAAGLLPLATGMLAVPIALGGATLLTNLWPMSSLVVNVVTMIGLALSVDYSLLIVDRFREARAAGLSSGEASIASTIHAGGTVLMSGLTVAIGFAGLLAVPVTELRSIAIGGLLATMSAVLLATTLLPGLLYWFGGGLELGRIWPRRTSRNPGRFWPYWAQLVTTKPLVVLVLASLPVFFLALQANRLELGLPRGEWLPSTAESTRAAKSLQNMGRSEMVDTIRFVLVNPPTTKINDPDGWRALEKLTAALANDPRIERVTSLAGTAAGNRWGPDTIDHVPKSILRTLAAEDMSAALIEAVPSRSLQSYEVSRIVRELRAVDSEALTGLPGAKVLIGGQPAFQTEYEDAVTGSFAMVVALVLLGTLATLIVAFRSVMVPIKAVALNLLSVAAGFGAVVLVFQDGYGAGVLGLAEPTGAVFPVIPALVFCAVFGISMDYEVFLVARVAECRRFIPEERAAVAEGLKRTGRLITGAAAIMIAVFSAFMSGDFLVMKMLGFALAVTVLIDATVVRMAIGPALLTLAGRWNWWPGESAAAASLPN